MKVKVYNNGEMEMMMNCKLVTLSLQGRLKVKMLVFGPPVRSTDGPSKLKCMYVCMSVVTLYI